MKYKKSFIFICLIICFFSIASVCASDINETLVVSENQDEMMSVENDEMVSTDDNASEVEVMGEDELSSTIGTFTDLANEISNASDELNLTKNYVYDGLGSLVINKKITIDGQGLIIDGKNKSGIFKISASNVVLKNLIFLNCAKYDDGGAIYWEGSQGTLDNCSFIHCKVSNGNHGGAVYWRGSNGILQHCSFINCSAGGNGVVYWGSSNGKLFDCNFINCNVLTTATSYGHGGAITWAGLYGLLFNCTFINCSAFSQTNTAEGGAIHWTGFDGSLFNCTFINCSSIRGGAIYYGGTMGQIYNSKFINCSSMWGGGVYYYANNGFLYNCSFIYCLARSYGSGISWYGENGTLLDTIFEKLSDSCTWKGKNGQVVNCTYIKGDLFDNSKNVLKILNKSFISITGNNEINYDEDLILNYSVTSGATGNVRIFVDSWFKKQIPIGEIIKLNGLTAGLHKIKVIYDGDENFTRSASTIIIKVNKLNPNINVSHIKTITKDVIIDVELDRNVSGNIKININNNEYSKQISNNRIRFYINDLPPGEYNYTVTYSGDKIFNSASFANNLSVQIRNANIKIKSRNITTVESLEVEYSITSGTTGILEVYIDNVFIKQVSVGSKIDLGKYFNDGKYQIRVIYKGDKYYKTCEDVVNIEVKKSRPELTISIDDIYVGDFAKVDYKISNGVTGFLSLYVNDNFVKNVSVGSEILISDLLAGKYNVKLIYNGNNIYEKCESSYKFTAIDIPLISFQDNYIFTLGESRNIDIYVTDSKGNFIDGGNIQLNDMIAPLNKGHSIFTISSKHTGVKSYKISYYPSENIFSSVIIDKAFSIFTHSPTKLTIESANVVVGTKFAVKYAITDALGKNVVINGTFIVNGKSYSNLTYLPSPKKHGTYYYDITFKSSNSDYLDSSSKLKIICKQQTKITVKSVTGYEGKKIKLTAIVKDALGKKIKTGTVKFKVKGKTFKAKVKNGKATVTIKVPVAKEYKTVTKKSGNKRTVTTYYKSVYNCKATFVGYKQYPSSSTKFKLTSKDKSYSYSYYVAKTSSSSSSYKKSTQTLKFNVPHASATVDVRVYTGSNYNTYSTQTNWLGNGAVSITETVGTLHEVYLVVHYYDGGFKTATYDAGSIILR